MDFAVCLEERHAGRRPHLLRPVKLADASTGGLESSYRPLESWPRQDQHREAEWIERADTEVRRRLESEEPEEWLHGWQLMVLTAPDAEFPRLVRETFSKALVSSLPNATLWTMNVDPRYQWRAALVRVLFGALETPELLDRSAEQFEGFSAGREFSHSSFGVDALLEPAMMAAAPWLLGAASVRVGGAVALLFGQPISGIKNTPVPELMSCYKPQVVPDVPPEPKAAPDIQASAIETFFRWWAERLNDLFEVLLDPARFVDGAGNHDPRAHFAVLLSVERLFTTLQAILAGTGRDEFSRRILMFDVLDLLEGVSHVGSETLLTAKKAREALERVRRHGAGATTPALEKCGAAVDALERVQEGFFMDERRTDAGIRVTDSHGVNVVIGIETAVAEHLRVQRTSTHSFMRTVAKPRARSLFASHTGHLPHGLPDLALLHVMDLLLRPERLASVDERI
jgi:hypothetical protein